MGIRVGKGSVAGLGCGGAGGPWAPGPSDPVASEVSVVGKGVVWSLWQPLWGQTQDRPLGKQGHATCLENNMVLGKQLLDGLRPHYRWNS